MTEANSIESPGRAAPHWILRALTRMHPLLNTLSGGRAFNTMKGTEVCFVTMTGAKTGRKRVVPLLYLPHGGGVILAIALASHGNFIVLRGASLVKFLIKY